MPHKTKQNRLSYFKNYAKSEKGKSKIEKWRNENRDRLRKSNRKYYEENKEKLLLLNKLYYKKNKERLNKISRITSNKRRNEIREKIFSHYGGEIPKCNCCGEKERKFLTLDHINGDGAKHRRETKSMSGVSMYLWAIKNNYPAIFQILCMNCNFAKGSNGVCPHQINEKNISKKNK